MRKKKDESALENCFDIQFNENNRHSVTRWSGQHGPVKRGYIMVVVAITQISC